MLLGRTKGGRQERGQRDGASPSCLLRPGGLPPHPRLAKPTRVSKVGFGIKVKLQALAQM